MGRTDWQGIRRTAGTFALGAAIGSLVSLLYAPTSGRVTRRRIAQKFQSVQRNAARQVERTTRQLAKKAAYLRETAAERLNGAREWVAGHMTNGQTRRHVRRHAAAHHA